MKKLLLRGILFKLFLAIVLLSNSITIFSQSLWQENIVIKSSGENIESPWWADDADIDGDGDIDLVCVSGSNLQVVWYENTDGKGNYKIQHLISSGGNPGRHVHAVDLDNDGDQDICWATGETVYWNENTDGKGSFGPNKFIFSSDLSTLYISDLDGDGALDVLGSSLSENSIFWTKNTDGLGNFGEKKIITTKAERTRDILCTDIDGDDDMDLVSASQTDNKVAWYENLDGEGTFGNQIIISDWIEGASSVSDADFDQDGDIDIVASMTVGTSIVWYENMDGLGGFNDGTILDNQADGAVCVRTGDIDVDGDVDILSSIMGLGEVAWFENNNGFFSEKKIISNVAYSSRFSSLTDIDGDEDLDVYICSLADKFSWVENSDGSGDFLDENVINRLSAKSPYIVECIDLNKDSHLDILFSSSLHGGNSCKIGYYLNDKN